MKRIITDLHRIPTHVTSYAERAAKQTEAAKTSPRYAYRRTNGMIEPIQGATTEAEAVAAVTKYINGAGLDYCYLLEKGDPAQLVEINNKKIACVWSNGKVDAI